MTQVPSTSFVQKMFTQLDVLEDAALAASKGTGADVAALREGGTSILRSLDTGLDGAAWMEAGIVQAPLRDALAGANGGAANTFASKLKAALHVTHSNLATYASKAAVRAEGLADDHVLANRVLDDLVARDPKALTVGDYRRLEAVTSAADTVNFSMSGNRSTLASQLYAGSELRGYGYRIDPHTTLNDGAAVMPTVRETDLLAQHVDADYMRGLTRAIRFEAAPTQVEARAIVERTRNEFASGSPERLRTALSKLAGSEPKDLTLGDRAQLSGLLDAADERQLFTVGREPQQAGWDNSALFQSTDMTFDSVGPLLSRVRLRLEGIDGAARDTKLASLLERSPTTWTNRDAFDVMALTEDATRAGAPKSDGLWKLNQTIRENLWSRPSAQLDDVLKPSFDSSHDSIRTAVDAVRS